MKKVLYVAVQDQPFGCPQVHTPAFPIPSQSHTHKMQGRRLPCSIKARPHSIHQELGKAYARKSCYLCTTRPLIAVPTFSCPFIHAPALPIATRCDEVQMHGPRLLSLIKTLPHSIHQVLGEAYAHKPRYLCNTRQLLLQYQAVLKSPRKYRVCVLSTSDRQFLWCLLSCLGLVPQCKQQYCCST